MVGFIEYCVNFVDSFWSWCDLMYCFVLKIMFDVFVVIVCWLYVEMFKCGYMLVCEFYYVYYV